MNTIWTLAKKDLRLLIRDKAGAFFTFGFPIMYALFFGMIFKNMGGGGGPTTMEIIVVDQDQTEASKAFIQKLNESDSTRIVEKNLDEAAELVQKGKKPAYVLIQEGYGEAAQNIFWGDPPAFEIGVDPSKRVQAMMLEGMLMQHAADNFSRAFSDKDTMSKQIAQSRESVTQSKDLNAAERVIFSTFFTALDSFMQNIPGGDETDGDTGGGFGGMTPAVITTKEITQQETDTGNTFNITFPQSLVWGLMGCAATFGISLVVERVRGTLVRLRMSPISYAQILAGKGLACFIGLITVNGIMLVFGMVVFDLSPSNYPFLILGDSLLINLLRRDHDAAFRAGKDGGVGRRHRLGGSDRDGHVGRRHDPLHVPSRLDQDDCQHQSGQMDGRRHGRRDFSEDSSAGRHDAYPAVFSLASASSVLPSAPACFVGWNRRGSIAESSGYGGNEVVGA